MSPVKCIGVIPARWGSTRFPGKSLTRICGKPLIQWVVEGACKARLLDRVIVATDDRRIAEAVRACGAEAVMTRSDHPSGTDRIAEAVVGIRAAVVVNIQGDEPLIDPRLIDRLASHMLANPKWDMATAACRIRKESELGNPSVVKVVWNRERGALYFSRWPIPFIRDPGACPPGLHWRHIGIYAYRRTFLQRLMKVRPSVLEQAEKLEQLRALHIGANILVLRARDCGTGVDRPEDVKPVERLIRRRMKRGK